MTNPRRNYSNPYQKIVDEANNVARLQFPADMGKYYISFQFADYSSSFTSAIPKLAAGANTVLTDLGLGSITPDGVEKFLTYNAPYSIGNIDAAISLPVPANLLDDQQLDYNAFNLINSVADVGKAVVRNAKGFTVASELANIVTAGYEFLSIASGQAVNPFMAMMFNGPKFKRHQFGWRFSAKTPQETAAITNISNFFKKKSLPKYSSAASFTYPSVVLISIYPESARKTMYTFKPCIIEQVSIHHAPSGTPSFFYGSNAPTEVELKIQLSEISIWTEEDL